MSADLMAPLAGRSMGPFCFLDLPTELRTSIYEFTLSEDEPVQVTKPVHDSSDSSTYISGQGVEQPGITKASRQTRSESLRLYYKLNNFHICIFEGRPLATYLTRLWADTTGGRFLHVIPRIILSARTGRVAAELVVDIKTSKIRVFNVHERENTPETWATSKLESHLRDGSLTRNDSTKLPSL